MINNILFKDPSLSSKFMNGYIGGVWGSFKPKKKEKNCSLL